MLYIYITYTYLFEQHLKVILRDFLSDTDCCTRLEIWCVLFWNFGPWATLFGDIVHAVSTCNYPIHPNTLWEGVLGMVLGSQVPSQEVFGCLGFISGNGFPCPVLKSCPVLYTLCWPKTRKTWISKVYCQMWFLDNSESNCMISTSSSWMIELQIKFDTLQILFPQN